MGNYLQKIQSAYSEVETKSPMQIVLDLYQQLETNLIANGAEEDSIEKTDIAYEQYRIETLLDVMDKKFIIEITFLKRTLSVLEDWHDSLS